MLVFARSPSVHTFGSLHQPEVYYPQSISPRDRYLEALAQARSAEAEYVAALAREQALQQRREDQQRQRAVLQRQRVEAVRKQSLLDALYSGDTTSFADHFSLYPAYGARQPVNPFDSEDIAIRRELELRRAVVQRQRQEELAKQRYIALVRQRQEEQRERAQAVIHLLHRRSKWSSRPGPLVLRTRLYITSCLFSSATMPPVAKYPFRSHW